MSSSNQISRTFNQYNTMPSRKHHNWNYENDCSLSSNHYLVKCQHCSGYAENKLYCPNCKSALPRKATLCASVNCQHDNIGRLCPLCDGTGQVECACVMDNIWEWFDLSLHQLFDGHDQGGSKKGAKK